MEPELSDTAKTNIKLEEKVKHLEEELISESEKRARFQREASIKDEKARNLSRRCEQLKDKIALEDFCDKKHFERVLEQQKQKMGGTAPSNNRTRTFSSAKKNAVRTDAPGSVRKQLMRRRLEEEEQMMTRALGDMDSPGDVEMSSDEKLDLLYQHVLNEEHKRGAVGSESDM